MTREDRTRTIAKIVHLRALETSALIRGDTPEALRIGRELHALKRTMEGKR